jgi:hypothetical protein
MPWFKVDDKFHDNRKSRAAKKAAIGVWALAGSWSADNREDGFVPESVLIRWGNKADAARLVEADLWEPSNKHGESGWQFLNWDEYQPVKADIEAVAELKRTGAKHGNHDRWHVKKGIKNPTCEFCQESV